MKASTKLAVTTALLVSLGAGEAVAGGDPTGVWIRSSGSAKISIGKCGGALCGTVVWEREPRKDLYNPDPSKRNDPVTGRRVLLGLKPDGADKWRGEVYNAEDGKTYAGWVTMVAPDRLKLQGCVLGGLICKSDTWSRTK